MSEVPSPGNPSSIEPPQGGSRASRILGWGSQTEGARSVLIAVVSTVVFFTVLVVVVLHSPGWPAVITPS